jgi:hypothetical protein
MKIKLNENLPEDVLSILTSPGHEASTALQQGLGGKPDLDFAAVCKPEDQVLITLDLFRQYPCISAGAISGHHRSENC